MKKTLAALMILAGVAMGAEPLLTMDFTALTGNTNDNTPAGWTVGQYKGGNNTPFYNFGGNGAEIAQPWKQNYLITSLALDSQGTYAITFTVKNGSEDTGNMFFLSSDTYSIVIGNSYNSNSEIYVGTLAEATGDAFASFQTDTGKNPTVLANSTGLDVSGTISYTLTMNGGNMTVDAALSNGASWNTTITGLEDVTFNKLGFMIDGAVGGASILGINVTAPESPVVPEPATATLSLLALAGLAARRRRK
ncbi:MAG: PEP-CTERM sorting domain-containing protein [Akkermansia sp.]|nr:PEP-CTERM sorting domain-containing protein [Akkermansia sp.]MBR5887211.1 PEP-CTERM sorting domain-containing protein [Akkermansia sp.]